MKDKMKNKLKNKLKNCFKHNKKNKINSIFVLFCFLFLSLFLSSCGKPPLIEKEAYLFGTRIEVLVADEEKEKGEQAISAVLKEFQRIHQTYHAWQPSLLNDLNQSILNNKPFLLTDEMRFFIQNAQELSLKSDGLFDPGIGNLIALWGFHSDEFKSNLPDLNQINLFLKEKPSIQQLEIKNNYLYSYNKNISLDFGGYLKGWALDKAAKILKENNIHHALINIGGNIMVLGTKFGKPWRIGIQHPRMPSPLAVLNLNDGEAIGTSGDYQRYFEFENKRYHHLLNPKTGFPADKTMAVTILMPKNQYAGLYSDVYSKPIFISGDDWQHYIQKLKLKNVLRINQNGEIEITRSFYNRLEFLNDSEKIKIVDE